MFIRGINKKLKRLACLTAFALLGVIIFAFFVFIKRHDFFDRFFYELKRPFTWDTTMYYAIGKGMSHGLKPYADMFETKPPMIFFLASISYSLTGDYYLCNLLSFVFLALISLAPFISVIILLVKSKEKNPLIYALFALSTLFVGLLMGGYLQLRAGEVQVELYGSFFIIAYLLTAKAIKTDSVKLYSPLVILSSVFLMIGVMFKEPFILVAFVCAMIFCTTLKDWLYRFILPCAYGGILGVLLLVCTGTFIPYLTIYLPHMMGNHISIYGSPIERMKKFEKLLNDIGGYSGLLQGIIVSLSLYTIIRIFCEKVDDNRAIAQVIYFGEKLLKVIFIPYVISFTVGLGGQYYNHHYIFALPCYALMAVVAFEDLYVLLHSAKDVRSSSRREADFIKKFTVGVLSAISIASLMGIYLLPKPNYEHYEKILTYAQTMKDDAEYVDEILDALGEDTYQYFGFNGPVFYCYTEHDPTGPVFFQDPNNLKEDDNFFATNLKSQMQEVDVYIVSYVKCGVLTDFVNDYIAKNFVLIEKSDKKSLIKQIEKPESFNYKIYVRKS